jgi:rod shape-determining protein MreC
MRGGHSPFKPRPRRSWRAPGELLNFSLFFICTMFLILSRIGHGAIEDARDGLVDLAAPLLEASSKPVIMARHAVTRVRSYVGAFEEIDRLKAENETLKQWEWRAKLAERNVSELRALLNAVDEPALNFVSGSVIADARGPFLRSVLINLGRDRGLRIGYAVINGDGLIGRTVDVGNAVTRVLLLNDLNSEIPVLVGQAGVRGLVSGDNGDALKLDFLPDGAAIDAGDEVFTSGSDGVLPRGLRVGVVTGSPGAFRVKPHADLNALDTVSVLFFDTPVLVHMDEAAIAAGRALSPASGDKKVPVTVPTASAEPSPVHAAIEQAGVSGALSDEDIGRSQQ